MQRFWWQTPKIPLHSRITHSSLGMTFLRMDKILKFKRITDKKYGGIVAYQIPISFFCIKFTGKPAWITHSISRRLFTCNRWKANKDIAMIANFCKQFCACVVRNITSDFECTVCASAFGMNYALRNSFAIKMRHTLYELMIGHHNRTIRPDS